MHLKNLSEATIYLSHCMIMITEPQKVSKLTLFRTINLSTKTMRPHSGMEGYKEKRKEFLEEENSPHSTRAC